MVKVKTDLTGMTFGRWTVLYQAEDRICPNGTREAQWMCRCSCENQTEKIVSGHALKRGQSKSCGCITKERISKLSMSRHKTNKYDLSGSFGIGWTSNTNMPFYFDIEDFDLIKEYCWHEQINIKTKHRVARAYSAELKDHIYMHQLISGKKDIDHKNLNPLDNRKNNLREATRSQQGANRPKQQNNTSGFIGVRWHKTNNKWKAEIKLNKKGIHLGHFVNKEDAIRARLEAEAKYFKEFAPQRHLFEQYGIEYNSKVVSPMNSP